MGWFDKQSEAPEIEPGRVEFVCTGNIVRSPFAEAAAVSMGLPPEAVTSSGIWAQEGRPCPAEAVKAAARLGVDLSHHEARMTERDRVGRAGWVVAMEYGHLRELHCILPSGYSGRLILLGECLPGSGVEIPDPYGFEREAFESVYGIILSAVRHLVRKVRRDRDR